MTILIDAIKAAANYLAPVIDDDALLDAIDSSELIIDHNDLQCILVGNIAKVYLLDDEEVSIGAFGEYENEFVFPLNEGNLNLVVVYI